jgi:hypothetical protein
MLIKPNIVTKGSHVPSTSITGSAVGAFISTNQPRWRWQPLDRDGTAYSAYGSLQSKPASNLLYESLEDAPTLVRVMPFTDTSTIAAGGIRVVGWTMYLDGTTEDWIPTVLADVTLLRTSGTTVSTTVGGVTYYPFADSSANAGTPLPNIYAIGNSAGAPPASVVVDAMGAQIIQVRCFASGGNMGCLWNVL